MWILVGWYEQNWWKMDNTSTECTQEEIDEAVEGYFDAGSVYLHPESAFIDCCFSLCCINGCFYTYAAGLQSEFVSYLNLLKASVMPVFIFSRQSSWFVAICSFNEGRCSDFFVCGFTATLMLPLRTQYQR